MRTITITTIAVVILMIGAPSAYAVSDYQSGFRHGVSDAKCVHEDGCQYYITEYGKGFQFHTWEFTKGFVIGYCSVSGPHSGFDADEATFDCDQGPTSASWVSDK